ncbi:MAG: hypothetical protein NDJ90_07605 [Oligoflexia bacterium]|nr:hypothetical protein [Oligoflexia bacterium]
MNRVTKLLALIALLLSVSLPGRAQAPLEQGPGVIDVQRRYQYLLLKLKGVQSVSTAACDARTGELITRLEHQGPIFPCIAVKVPNASDLAAIEAVFGNPLRIDGAVIHFTQEDGIPVRSGITVHN